MSNKYKRLLSNGSRESDFWPTFTDLLSTILLVVLIIFVAFIISLNKESKALQAKAKMSQVKIEKQAKEIAKKEREIEALSYIQKDIIKDLEKSFREKKLPVSIDKDTGAIKFSNDLLFETNSDVIKPEFEEMLHKFIPVYFSTLYGKYQDSIAEVVVEGHTDDVGTYLSNLDLSQRRASSVVKYILSDQFGDFPFKVQVTKDITANGRSESQLKYVNGKVDRNLSRRVEFKFRLKNSH